MLKTFRAVIEKGGKIRPLEENVTFDKSQKVLITILDEENNEVNENEPAYLSEKALGEDWNKQEEDEAWEHLQ